MEALILIWSCLNFHKFIEKLRVQNEQQGFLNYNSIFYIELLQQVLNFVLNNDMCCRNVDDYPSFERVLRVM